MEHSKNDWEEIKDGVRALKGAAGLVFGALFFSFMMVIAIGTFVELFFQIVLTTVQAVLITVGIFLIPIVKAWWSDRQSTK